MVVEQGRSVCESHATGCFDDSSHGEARVLQELTNPGRRSRDDRHARAATAVPQHRRASCSTRSKTSYNSCMWPCRFVVSATIGTSLRHSATLAHRARPIIEVVHTQVRDDEVEGPVIERHLRRDALVHGDVPGTSTRNLLFRACQRSRPRIDSMNVGVSVQAAPPVQ